jgi:hypothetical protein
MNWAALFYDQAIEAVHFPEATSGFAVASDHAYAKATARQVGDWLPLGSLIPT